METGKALPFLPHATVGGLFKFVNAILEGFDSKIHASNTKEIYYNNTNKIETISQVTAWAFSKSGHY